jgi:hypothetical protein
MTYTQKEIEEAIAALAAKGLIRDSGERRDGHVCWVAVPGKEAETKALLGLDSVGEDKGEQK